MREVIGMLEVLADMIEPANDEQMPNNLADRLPVMAQRQLLRVKTLPRSPYSKAARAVIMRAGWAELCVKPEEV